MTFPSMYQFSAISDGDRHITGWCRRITDLQPVEVLFKAGDRTLFAVTANREVDIEGNDELCGFDVTLDLDFWKVSNKLEVCTPAGEVIITVEKPVLHVRKRDVSKIDHKFDHPSMIKISGTFQFIDDGDAPEHYVKLFSGGSLEAFLTTTVQKAEGQVDGTPRAFRYRFIAAKGRPILDRIVFAVVNDQYAFLTRSHTPMVLEADDKHYVLPLPIDINDVVGTETSGVDAHGQPMLFGMRQYLGWGWGSVLVFDRQADLKCVILMEDGSSLRILHSKGHLGIAELGPKAFGNG